MARRAMPALSAAVLLGLGRSAGDAATRRLSVLVAEADPSRREMLRAALAGAGEQARCVATWEALLGELSRNAVDAVLLSLELPHAGGLAAARTLRAWPAPVRALPLLGLHGGRTRVQERDWRDAGFDALLVWPGCLDGVPALLRQQVVRLTPAEPLDAQHRAELRAELGPEALAARDLTALREAGALLARLAEAADAAAAREAAEALAAACASIGASDAAAAARAAARHFPPATNALMGALAEAGAAIRFEGRARR